MQITSGSWTFHLIKGNLSIVNEQENTGIEIQLNAQEAYDLFQYLWLLRDELSQASIRVGVNAFKAEVKQRYQLE